MKTAEEILRKHYDADNSVDENAITQAMEEYASQYQERIKELESMLMHICVNRSATRQIELKQEALNLLKKK